jgi:hypothetical protein
MSPRMLSSYNRRYNSDSTSTEMPSSRIEQEMWMINKLKFLTDEGTKRILERIMETNQNPLNLHEGAKTHEKDHQ